MSDRPIYTRGKDPCLGCEDRYVDVEHGTRCHSTCEKYLAARDEAFAKKRLEWDNGKKDYIWDRYASRSAKKQNPRRYR